jgi:hypothetical protein
MRSVRGVTFDSVHKNPGHKQSDVCAKVQNRVAALFMLFS